MAGAETAFAAGSEAENAAETAVAAAVAELGAPLCGALAGTSSKPLAPGVSGVATEVDSASAEAGTISKPED